MADLGYTLTQRALQRINAAVLAVENRLRRVESRPTPQSHAGEPFAARVVKIRDVPDTGGGEYTGVLLDPAYLGDEPIELNFVYLAETPGGSVLLSDEMPPVTIHRFSPDVLTDLGYSPESSENLWVCTNAQAAGAEFWARIDGSETDDTCARLAYSFTEMEPDTCGEFAELPGGRVGTVAENPLYEANHNETVEVGTIVRARPGALRLAGGGSGGVPANPTGTVETEDSAYHFYAAAGDLSTVDAAYDGWVLMFTSGTNEGIGRVILNYFGSLHSFIFDATEPFPAVPTAGDTFELIQPVSGSGSGAGSGLIQEYQFLFRECPISGSGTGSQAEPTLVLATTGCDRTTYGSITTMGCNVYFGLSASLIATGTLSIVDTGPVTYSWSGDLTVQTDWLTIIGSATLNVQLTNDPAYGYTGDGLTCGAPGSESLNVQLTTFEVSDAGKFTLESAALDFVMEDNFYEADNFNAYWDGMSEIPIHDNLVRCRVFYKLGGPDGTLCSSPFGGGAQGIFFQLSP